MLPDLKERIESAAKASGRSMNAEIVARLQASFDAPSVGTSHARTVAAPDELQVLYAITVAQIELQQATMQFSEAKDEAFRASAHLARRELELRDSEESGQDDAFISVRRAACHEAQKEFKSAQRAVQAAKEEVHAKQTALSDLHMLRATGTNIPDPRNLKRVTAEVQARWGDTKKPGAETTP
ncbi:Arc family DNA-binding protein [Simplicispira piscis]